MLLTTPWHLVLLLGFFCLSFCIRFEHEDRDMINCEYTPGIAVDTTFWFRLTHQWHGPGVSLAVASDLVNVKLVNSTNSDDQLWRFIRAARCDNWYYITNKAVFGLRMAKFLQPIPNTNNVQMVWKSPINKQVKSQRWRLFKDTKNLWTKLQPDQYAYRNKSITLINDGKENKQFQLRNTGNNTGQNWKLTPVLKVNDSLPDFDEGRGRK